MPDPLSRLLKTLAAPSAEDVSDAELLGRGDAASLELVIRRHAGMVWRVCMIVTRDPHTAEDAFQATFLALARKPEGVRERSAAGWLHRVAYRLAQRARPAFTPIEFPEPEEKGFSPVEQVEQAETAEAVLDAVSQLPDRYRVPVVLCHLEGYTQTEAAAQLGLPLGTVAVRVKRGLERLRGMLARNGVAAASVLVSAFSGVAFAAPPQVVFRATELASGTAAPSSAVLGLLRQAFAGGAALKLVALASVLTLAVGGIVWGRLVEPRPAQDATERVSKKKVESVGYLAFPVTTDLQRRLLGDGPVGTCICLGSAVNVVELRETLRSGAFPKGQGVVFVRRSGIGAISNDALVQIARDCGFLSTKVIELDLLPPDRWEEAKSFPAKEESATFLGSVAVHPVGTPLSRILTGGADAALAQVGPSRPGDESPAVAGVRAVIDSLELPAKQKLVVLARARRPGDDHERAFEREHERKRKPGRGLEALAGELGFETVSVISVARTEHPDQEHDREHGGRPPRK